MSSLSDRTWAQVPAEAVAEQVKLVSQERPTTAPRGVCSNSRLIRTTCSMR